jgi:hypothetical protein
VPHRERRIRYRVLTRQRYSLVVDNERAGPGIHSWHGWLRDPVTKTIAAGLLLYILIAAEAGAPKWITIAYLVGPVLFCCAFVVVLRTHDQWKRSRPNDPGCP